MENAPRRITDMAPTLYTSDESRRPIERVGQIELDLWTWWAEADLSPSPIRLKIDGERLLDNEGYDLVLQTEAAGIIRQGRVEQERVRAENQGVENLRKLIVSGHAQGGVIYLSPPGSEEEGFGAEGKRRLSFTYLYHIGGGGRVRMLAVPEREVATEEHFERIARLINEEKTKEITGMERGGLGDRELVGFPFAAGNGEALDEAARGLGYQSLMDLWRQALEKKRMRGMAGEVIKHAAKEIWEAYQEKDMARLEVLGDVFRGVVALLVSDGFGEEEEIIKYYDEKVAAILAVKQVDRLGGVSGTMIRSMGGAVEEFYWRLLNNERAMEVLQGGSCPGDRGSGIEVLMYGLRREEIVSNHAMLDALGMGGSISGSETSDESAPKGKYTEYYDYYADHCKGPCRSWQPYVAHKKPEKPHVPCGGWCSRCEK